MIYLDTCALLKLIRHEPETPALTAWINDRAGTMWFTAEVARTELARSLRRINHDQDAKLLDADLKQAADLCERLDLIPMTTRVLTDAAALEQPFLRTIDALHIAAAAGLRASVSAFVTYDKRLAAAAETAGLPVAAPA